MVVVAAWCRPVSALVEESPADGALLAWYLGAKLVGLSVAHYSMLPEQSFPGAPGTPREVLPACFIGNGSMYAATVVGTVCLHWLDVAVQTCCKKAGNTVGLSSCGRYALCCYCARKQ